MLIYAFLCLIAIILIILRDSYFYKDVFLRKVILSSVYFFLFLIYIFRSVTVGTDYKMYYYFFHSPTSVLQDNYIEKGYILINEFTQYFSNFFLLSLIAGLLVFIGVILLFKSLDINKFSGTGFFILTYMYFFQFNLLRASIANGIILIGMSFLFKKYKYKYMGIIIFSSTVILASLIHTTSLFAMFFILFTKININKKIVIFSAVFYIISNFIYNLYGDISKVALWLFPSYIYKYGELYGQNSNGFNINKVPMILLLFFTYMYVRYNDKMDIKHNFILMGVLISIITFNAGDIIGRISVFLNIFNVLFSCLLIDDVLEKCHYSNMNKYIIRVIFIMFWVCLFFVRLYTNNSGIVPYAFW